MKVKLLFAFFILLSTSLFAQDESGGATPNELDKIYTPDKNSILNSSGSATSSSEGASGIYVKNAVKFNPFLLARSIAALNYECWLNDQISAQGGLGFSYNKDRIFYSFSGVFELGSERTSSLKLNQILSQGNFVSGPNVFFSAAFRFYTDNYFESDWNGYFEIGMRYNSNTLQLADNTTAAIINGYNSSSNGNSLVRGNPTVNIRNTSFNIMYGYQFITSGTVKTTHDFYFGFGIRSTSYNTFKSITLQTASGNTLMANEITTNRESALSPAIMMGYAFGFGF